MKRVTEDILKHIRSLREQGFTIPEISKQVGISKTSVLRYVKNVDILPQFIKNWTSKRGGSKNRKLFKEKQALEEAKSLIKSLSKIEKLVLISALYWAEGNKKDFIITNTDPTLIKTFVLGLKDVFDINSDQLQVSIRIYEDIDREKSLKFWSEVVNVPKEKFINVHVLKGKKKGKLEYGMCRVRIGKGGDILKKVFATNAVIANLMAP